HQLLPSIGLLILRVGMGGYMITHGLGKLKMLIAGDYSMWADPTGMLGNTASLALAVFGEFVCAILIVLGLATRQAAIPLVITMGVAALVVHGSDPWTMQTAAERFFAGEAQHWGSKQPALMFLVPFLALIFTGPGRFSLDALIVPMIRLR